LIVLGIHNALHTTIPWFTRPIL